MLGYDPPDGARFKGGAMKTLYIIRGLPGSGKSTLARKLAPHMHFETDDYFVGSDGVYRWNPKHLKQAHLWCQKRVEEAMYFLEQKLNHRNQDRLTYIHPVIAVSNTFSTQWEVDPYLNIAKCYGYNPNLIECQHSYGSIHSVPEKTINSMRERWETVIVDPRFNQTV